MLIADAHLDLAYNALRFGRDIRRPVADIRERERGARTPNGVATVALPELFAGGIGLVFGSIFVLPERQNRTLPDNRRLVFATADEAYRAAIAQLDYYERLADEDERVRLVRTPSALDEVVASHDDGAPLLGIVPLMEGADPIRDPEELEEWYERGVRVIGPAWDDNRYAPGGWRGHGGFTKEGRLLLEIMADLGLILDVTHLSEEAIFEALDRYEGAIVATHCNARALSPGTRHLSDVQLRMLAEREGVVGVVFNNGYLKADYAKTDLKESVPLSYVVAHIDHICQVVGDARHVGIGTDMDGGFGRADVPAEIDTIADIGLVAPALAERGYSSDDIAAVMGMNWVRCLRRAWGAG